MLSRRAAIFTPSPKTSCGSIITSPTLMPTRKAIRLSSASAAVSSLTRVWNCKAARTAPTALGNSAKNPSPVFLTMRPPCSAIAGLHHPLAVRSVWCALPLRHGALAANSPLRQRPISLPTFVQPGLAALAPWRAIQPTGSLYGGSEGSANRVFRMMPARKQPICNAVSKFLRKCRVQMVGISMLITFFSVPRPPRTSMLARQVDARGSLRQRPVDGSTTDFERLRYG